MLGRLQGHNRTFDWAVAGLMRPDLPRIVKISAEGRARNIPRMKSRDDSAETVSPTPTDST